MQDSLFLMAQPSFLEGAARVLDLSDSISGYNSSPTGEEADHAALSADWDLIAGDLRRAAKEYAESLRRVEAE